MQFAILLCLPLVAHSISDEVVAKRQIWFNRIKTYESIHVNLDEFYSNNIIAFDAFNNHYKIQLTLNKDVHPIELKRNQMTGAISEHKPHPDDEEYCFHQGKVLSSMNDSLVALSTCRGQGIRGRIRAFGEVLFINPMAYYHEPLSDNMQLSDEHIIYKSIDYDWESEAPEYGEPEADIHSLYHHRELSHGSAAMRRLLGSGGTVEMLGVIDKTWVNAMGSIQATRSEISAIVNEASSLFTDNNLPSELRVSISWRYVVYDTMGNGNCNCKSPTQSHCNEVKGRWCLSKLTDIASPYRKNQDFNFLWAYHGGGGLATSNSICDPGRAYSVSKGNRARQALTVAHELGHVLGARHDGSRGYIMDTKGSGGAWSSQSIRQFKDKKYQRNSAGIEGWQCLYENKMSRTFGSDNNLGSSGGGDSGGSGPCCSCASNPSKHRCSSSCQLEVAGEDSYCMQMNSWDSVCKSFAKKLCSDAYIAPCEPKRTEHHRLCFYEDELEEAQEFVLRECVDNENDRESYEYIEYNVNGTAIDAEYWLHFDTIMEVEQWIISEDTASIYGDYLCEESDILECTAGKWRKSYFENDTQVYKVDEKARIVPCEDGSATKSVRGNESMIVVVALVGVALMIIVGGFIGICCKKKRMKRIGLQEVPDEENDDGDEIEVNCQVGTDGDGGATTKMVE